MKVPSVGSMTKGLMTIYLVTFLRGLLFGILDLTLPLYFASIGISMMNLGTLIAFSSVGMLCSEPIWGFLSDKISRKFFIVVSLLFTSLIVPMYLFIELVPIFFLLQFLRGSIRMMAAPSIRASISDMALSKDLGTTMGLLWSTLSVGSMVGSLVAGACTYGDSFWISSIIALSAGVLSLLGIRESRRRKRCDTNVGYRSKKSRTQDSKFPLRRNASIVLSLAAISIMGSSLIRSFLPMFTIQRLNASDVEAGAVLATFSGVTALAMPLFGKISDRIGRKILILTGLCLFGSMMLCYTVAGNVHQVVLVTVGAAACFSLITPSLPALLISSVTSDSYGAAMGVYGASEDLGAMIGPAIYGIFWSAYGSTSIFYVCVLMETIGLILGLILRENTK